MDHAYFRDRVSAFHDRELPPQELVIVEEHIRGCAECQQLLADMEKFDAAVAARMNLADSDYWESLALKTEERLGFIEKTEVTPIRRGWDRGLVWKITAVAASIAVLVFIGINKDDIIKQDDVVTPPATQIAPETTSVDTSTTFQGRREQESTETATQPPTEQRTKTVAPGQADIQRRMTPETVQFKPDRERQAAIAADTVEAETGNYVTDLRTAPAPGTTSLQESDRSVQDAQKDERVQPLPVEPRVTKQELAQPETSRTQASAPQRIPKTKETKKITVTAESPQESQPQAETYYEADMSQTATDSAASEAELQSWRQQRDSLTRVLKARKVQMIERYGISSFRSTDSGAKRLQSAVTSEQQQVATERAYLEASYQVALLTPNAQEYRDARASLEEAASRGKSVNARLARRYLDQLDQSRRTRPRN